MPIDWEQEVEQVINECILEGTIKGSVVEELCQRALSYRAMYNEARINGQEFAAEWNRGMLEDLVKELQSTRRK